MTGIALGRMVHSRFGVYEVTVQKETLSAMEFALRVAGT